MKLNPSIAAALTGVVVIAACYGGWRAYNTLQLNGFNPTPVKPGKVTLVGIDTRAGYKIIVANEVAQLAEVQDRQKSDREEDPKNLRRIPIREFMRSLQGDASSLGRLVMSLNKINEEELIGAQAVWRAEDIRKALDGDQELRKKLETDLHVSLKGVPPAEIRKRVLLGGIVIDSPVKVKVPIEGKVETLEARISEPYMSRFGHQMEKVIGERFNPTDQDIAALYQAYAAQTTPGQPFAEDVEASLVNIIDSGRLQRFAEKPELLLKSATVLVNESHITDASYREWEGGDKKQYADITVKVTNEGKMRLWKYSDAKNDFQLMFIVDDVALAAPTITSVLNRDDVTIAQLPNRGLAKNAVEFMRKKR